MLQLSTAPHTSGVYQICCLPTGKIYIGSAIHLKKRWAEHRRSLCRGKHVNRYLQSAWDKYGESAFAFSVLEYVRVSDLLSAEQEWIDTTNCIDREIGFNIAYSASSPGGANIGIWDGFFDPQGNQVCIVGLQNFCDQNNLDYRSMHRLATGKSKLKSYKGWTHRNSIRQREKVRIYDGFIDPHGSLVEPITNLAEFCRNNDLDLTHMVAVAKGRICSYRGWTHSKGRQRQEQKTYTGFVNPSNERVIIINLAAFCREHNLHTVKMRHLKSGKIKTYKGWTWRNDHDAPTISGGDAPLHQSPSEPEQSIFAEACT